VLYVVVQEALCPFESLLFVQQWITELEIQKAW